MEMRLRVINRAAAGDLTTSDCLFLLELFNHRCAYCDVFTGDNGDLDHIIPVSKGGLSILCNVANACESCNRGTGGKMAQEVFTWWRSQPFWTQEREVKLRAHMDSGILHTDRTEFLA
jgi:5-methylcytosine-specific restriction endonuclease McrA